MFNEILEYDDHPKIENRFIMHLDLDAFYASVEIRANPELRGKKLLVGNKNAKITNRGVVSTCSYEARKYGVHSGMPMREALQLCPDAVISSDARGEYKPTSDRIMAFLRSLKTPIAVTSIDEAYLDITDLVHNFDEAYQLAEIIQQIIVEKEKLTCSIGIGPTLKIAKMASDYKKPHGITVVPESKFEEFFNNQPLIKIPGIGPKLSQSLEKRGFVYCHQLASHPEGELVAMLGEFGHYLWKIFRGLTSNTISTRSTRKSISHERTFHGKPMDILTYNGYLSNLVGKTHQILIEKKMMTKTLTLKIRYNGFDTITRAISLGSPTDDINKILQTFQTLADSYFYDERGIRLIGVKFSNLEQKKSSQTNIIEFF